MMHNEHPDRWALRRRGAGTAPFCLGEWTVFPDRNLLCGPGIEKTVQPKIMRLLTVLANASGQTLAREVLIDHVWDGLVVSDAAIDRAVCNLRKALDDSASAPKFIETVRKKGIRLMVEPTALPEKPKGLSVPVQTFSFPVGVSGELLAALSGNRDVRALSASLMAVISMLAVWSVLDRPVLEGPVDLLRPIEASLEDGGIYTEISPVTPALLNGACSKARDTMTTPVGLKSI